MSQRKDCTLCAKIGIVLLCAALGAAAGFAAVAAGAPGEMSMAATFLGAMVPLLWQARRSRNKTPR